jgi:hypothetical protein
MAVTQPQSLDGAHEVNPGRLEIDGIRPTIAVESFMGTGDITGHISQEVETTNGGGYRSNGFNIFPRTGMGIIVGEIRRAIHAGHAVTAGGRRSEGGTEFRTFGPLVIGESGKGLSVGRFGLKRALDI